MCEHDNIVAFPISKYITVVSIGDRYLKEPLTLRPGWYALLDDQLGLYDEDGKLRGIIDLVFKETNDPL